MATVKFKDIGLQDIKSTSVKVGWFDTPIHPGYPGRPGKVTVAQVAKYNTKTRNFAELFIANFFSNNTEILSLLAKDISTALTTRKMTGSALAEYMMDGLIQTICLAPWQPNTEQWLKFKMKNGLSLDPLIASQVMLDSIQSVVTPL